MGTVHEFPPTKTATNVQLSRYPQPDGSSVYCVEVLFNDDTWEIVGHSKQLANGWKLAGCEAIDRRVPLLPKSTFPGRAA